MKWRTRFELLLSGNRGGSESTRHPFHDRWSKDYQASQLRDMHWQVIAVEYRVVGEAEAFGWSHPTRFGRLDGVREDECSSAGSRLHLHYQNGRTRKLTGMCGRQED